MKNINIEMELHLAVIAFYVSNPQLNITSMFRKLQKGTY